MTIPEIIAAKGQKGFSFEVLPPLKGRGIESLFRSIEPLREKQPLYVNITTHRSETVFRPTDGGLYERVTERARPGTVAVAAAIQNRLGLTAVPHMICSGFSRRETEYALIDLNFLGITNVLALRGDKAKHESRFIPNEGGHSHAIELQGQINRFNDGYFDDGTQMDLIEGHRFSVGVAGYPEKHEESPNSEMDILWLKAKVDAGADYVVTQMFFDNAKYFSFVKRCRAVGINVPIVPGIKPLINVGQLSLLAKVFKVDIPTDLAREMLAADTDEARRQVGIEWGIAQARELYAAGVPSIHYYSLNAVKSVDKILEATL